MLSYGWGVCEWEGSHTSRQEEGEEEGGSMVHVVGLIDHLITQ